MRRTLTLAMVLALALTLSAGPALAAPGGLPGSPIHDDLVWVDGTAYGTIPLKALPYNGHEDSYDLLYIVNGGERLISAVAPGDADYNGGRWIPVMVTFDGDGSTLTSYADIVASGAHVGMPLHDGAFLCPLIP